MPVKWTPENDQLVSISISHQGIAFMQNHRPPSYLWSSSVNGRLTSIAPQLLLKILETSSVHADTKAIAAAWRKSHLSLDPTTTPASRPIVYVLHALALTIHPRTAKDRPDQPTARAITERLVKIRKDCKANSGAHFSVSSAQNKNGGGPAANGAHRANNSLMNGAANGAAHPETPHRGRAAKENGAASLGSGTGSSTGKRKRNAIKIEDDDEGEEEVTIVGSHQRRDVAIKREDAGERAQEEDDSPTKRVKAMDLRENDVFNDAVYVPQPYSPYYDEESGEEAV